MKTRPAGRCGLFLLGFLLLLSEAAMAASGSVILTPRFESLHGKESLGQRALLKIKSSGQAEPYAFYIEGFGEFESDEARRDERRIGDGFFLQEAYLEFKIESLYVRAGKQAMRWSEMWVLPSLDIWTGRRWNRLLYDPQTEQFDHSGGVSFSWASEGLSVDAALLTEVARSRYPEPLPEFLDGKDEEKASGGLRLKFDLAGVGTSLVVGKANWAETVGAGFNYAFETFVPKLEIGETTTKTVFAIPPQKQTFATMGADIFFGELTFQPQATFFQVKDSFLGDTDQQQSLFYLGATWAHDKHDIQAQTFTNTETKDFFLNVFYGYNFKNWIQLGGFVQNYQGPATSLFGLYEQMTGGWVYGVRIELNGGLSTD